MNGLMLHCGAQKIDRTALQFATPNKGALGARHNPVPYIDFVEQVSDQLEKMGLVIEHEGFGITKDNDRFFGLMQLRSKYSDYAPMLGLRGSYNQTLPRGIVLGSGIFVCDNLAFSGEINIKTKQTTYIRNRLPALIEGACERIPGMIELQHQKFEAYRNKEMRPRWGDAAIVELVRRDAISPSQVGKVVEQWDNPVHMEHAEQGHSLWRLHNAVTEAIKPVTNRPVVLNNMERTQRLTAFLDEVAGL